MFDNLLEFKIRNSKLNSKKTTQFFKMSKDPNTSPVKKYEWQTSM